MYVNAVSSFSSSEDASCPQTYSRDDYTETLPGHTAFQPMSISPQHLRYFLLEPNYLKYKLQVLFSISFLQFHDEIPLHPKYLDWSHILPRDKITNYWLGRIIFFSQQKESYDFFDNFCSLLLLSYQCELFKETETASLLINLFFGVFLYSNRIVQGDGFHRCFQQLQEHRASMRGM